MRTSDLEERGPTLDLPARDKNGAEWHRSSWPPCVVDSPGLDRYVMVSYGVSSPG